MPLMRGHILSNRYEVIDTLSLDGGSAIVYDVWDKKDKKKIVAKECFPREMVVRDGVEVHSKSRRKYERIKQAFVDEGKIHRSLVHTGIGKHIDTFEENNSVYLIMEKCRGETLKDLIAKRYYLEIDEAMEIFVQILDIVEYLHKNNIIHRDIKPGNLMIEGERVRLIDFGSARMIHEEKDILVDKETYIKVSKGYSPPEQYEVDSPTRESADIYGSAATLYYMLMGVSPTRTRGKDLIYGMEIPREYERLIERCMELEESKRYQSVTQVREALENIITSEKRKINRN